jgi:hypothetical protein
MRCHWVYCCEPIEQEPVMLSCKEPGPTEENSNLALRPLKGSPNSKLVSAVINLDSV